MANNTSAGTNEDMLVCPICLEQYEVPRALPCLHTFCEKCLIDWVRHKSVTNTLTIGSLCCFPCPVCKDDVSVPPEGIKGFRHNFYVSNMVEPSSPAKKLTSRNNSEDDLDKGKACKRCEEIGVSMICIKCNIWLCPLCCEDHKRVKGTKSHVLGTHAKLKEAEVSDDLSNNELSVCSIDGHDKTNGIYCIECKEMLCELCQKMSHDKHDTINVVCNLDEVRNALLNCIGRLQTRSDVLRRQHSSLSNAKKDLVSQGHKVLRDFDKSIAAIYRKMQVMKGNLHKNLKKHITEQVNRLDERTLGINDKLLIEETVEEEIQALIDSGNKRDICSQANLLCEQGERCLSTHLINSENIITVTSPVWKLCEDDLFDQLLTKLLGSCEYVGLEINLNKRVKSRKSKRSHSNSPRTTKKDDDDITRSQAPCPSTSSECVSANQLCEIIRDFDPLRQTAGVQVGVSSDANNILNASGLQQTRDTTIDEKVINEVLNQSNEDLANENAIYYRNYPMPTLYDELISGCISDNQSSPASDADESEQAIARTRDGEVEEMNVQPPPPQGPFYPEEGSDLHYWWSPPHPGHFHPPPPPAFHRPPRHVSPHHRGHPPHHPPPHHMFGGPHNRGHHRMRGRRGRRGPVQ